MRTRTLIAAALVAVSLPVYAADAPILERAASVREHGIAGAFAIPLSLDPSHATVEPRGGGHAVLLLTFDQAVSTVNAAITHGEATIAAVQVIGREVLVSLAGVANAQWVTVALTNAVSAQIPYASGSGAVMVGFLYGDVNQNRVVTVSDVAQVNAQIARFVTSANFLKDINANGAMTIADKAITNTQVTRALPTLP
jgi:hypothetical protein